MTNIEKFKTQVLVGIAIAGFIWVFHFLGQRAERVRAIKCIEICKAEEMPLLYWDHASCVCGDRDGQNIWIKRSPTNG